MCKLITWGAWISQGLGGGLILLPYTPALQAVAALLLFSEHVGMLFTMNLGGFAEVCLVTLLALAPGSFWDAVQSVVSTLFARKRAGRRAGTEKGVGGRKRKEETEGRKAREREGREGREWETEEESAEGVREIARAVILDDGKGLQEGTREGQRGGEGEGGGEGGGERGVWGSVWLCTIISIGGAVISITSKTIILGLLAATVAGVYDNVLGATVRPNYHNDIYPLNRCVQPS